MMQWFQVVLQEEEITKLVDLYSSSVSLSSPEALGDLQHIGWWKTQGDLKSLPIFGDFWVELVTLLP